MNRRNVSFCHILFHYLVQFFAQVSSEKSFVSGKTVVKIKQGL